MCLALLFSICIGNINCKLQGDNGPQSLYNTSSSKIQFWAYLISNNSIMVWLIIIEDVYVNWTICVPNHANRRILVHHRIGLPKTVTVVFHLKLVVGASMRHVTQIFQQDLLHTYKPVVTLWTQCLWIQEANGVIYMHSCWSEGYNSGHDILNSLKLL